MGRYCSFVVKIWTDENRHASRGQIQHVGTEEMIRFVDMGKMIEFILAHLEPSADPASPSQGQGRHEGTNDASDS